AGRPTRVWTELTSLSLWGPDRTWTRSDLRLTKRGSGNPLGPFGPLGTSGCAAAAEPVASARMKTTAAPDGPHLIDIDSHIAKRGAPRTMRMPARGDPIGLICDTPAAGSGSLSCPDHLVQRDPNCSPPLPPPSTPAVSMKRVNEE